MIGHPNLSLTRRVSYQLASLRERVVRVRLQTATAEILAGELNALITELGDIGYLPKTALLGPVIQNRACDMDADGHHDGQIVQAALLVPRGIGVCIWGLDEYAALWKQQNGLEAEASSHFLPFEQCIPLIRALLEEHVEDFLTRLPALLS